MTGRTLDPPRLVADVRHCIGCEQRAARASAEPTGEMDDVTRAGLDVYLREARPGDYGPGAP